MELVTKYNNRDIYYFSGRLYQTWSEELKLPEPYFICTLFLHQSNWSEEELKKSIRRLIKGGCVYFLFHGNRCAEAHDCADQTYNETTPNIGDENVIITTWHENESERDVIFAALCNAWPAKDYEEKFSSYVFISLGTPGQNKRVRGLLSNPDATVRQAIRR